MPNAASLNESAKNIHRAVSASAADLKDSGRTLVDDAKEFAARLTSTMSDTAKVAGGEAGRIASDTARAAEEAAERAYLATLKQAEKSANAVGQAVNSNPATALLAALGIGLFIGIMTRK